MKPASPQLQVPSPWVMRFAASLPPGRRALDVACGRGRHSRALAARGCLVEAVDRDEEALRTLEGLAGVTARRADLEVDPWPLAGRRFELVVVTNYLHRPLFAALADAVEVGGRLVYETFMRGQERLGKPSNPAFLLEPTELLHAFPGLVIVAFEQGEVASPAPAFVQRLCAAKLTAAGEAPRLD